MAQQIINSIVPVAIAAIVAVLVAIVKSVGNALVALIEKKAEALRVKIGADVYTQRLSFARQAWEVVDEYFRITPTVTKTIAAAQEKFAEEIKKRVPDITDEEIEQLRQAVAGEVNKGRAAIVGVESGSTTTATDSAAEAATSVPAGAASAQ